MSPAWNRLKINQPLTRIQAYARNSALFWSAARQDVVDASLAGNSSACANKDGRAYPQFNGVARSPRACPSQVGPALAIDAALKIISRPGQNHGISIELQRPDDAIMVHWRSDSVIEQVIVNLIANARTGCGKQRQPADSPAKSDLSGAQCKCPGCATTAQVSGQLRADFRAVLHHQVD